MFQKMSVLKMIYMTVSRVRIHKKPLCGAWGNKRRFTLLGLNERVVPEIFYLI